MSAALIESFCQLLSEQGQRPKTPVVGSLQARNCPTSGDVHLYSDPRTCTTAHPILYADCEGLEGGEIEPTAILRKASVNEAFARIRRPKQPKKPRKAHYGSERQITWATTAELKSRMFAVTNLYPRFLYTFSDVVVFVLHNGR